jgi:hypothetical protein
MNGSRKVQVLLLVAGTIAVSICGATLLAPVAFDHSSGIELGGHVDLLSETRASGGGLVAIGTLILSGFFVRRLRPLGTVVAAVVYLGYGLPRLLSMVIDVVPGVVLSAATVVDWSSPE